MAYTKTNWQTGDTITAAKLNNMENGIESASAWGDFVVTFTFGGSGFTADKTNAQIYAAYQAGQMVCGKETMEGLTNIYELKVISETKAIFVNSIYDTSTSTFCLSQVTIENDSTAYNTFETKAYIT